ncbi:MAG: glycosyltransferase [bacterium]|nr:glycosyltransferase [bacterium]
MSKIGITFAIYNNINYTIKCLNSILNNNSKNDLYIVVVNNASTDGSAQLILSEYSNVKIINNTTNLGCARAWNQGLLDCKQNNCDYFVLTQNDVIISNGILDRSVNFLNDNKNIKLVSPFTINVSHESKKNMTQDDLNIVAEKAMRQYVGCVHRFFCMYFFMMMPEIFDKYPFDEIFKKALYEDTDFYTALALDRVLSCSAIDVGLMFHRHSATQAIARNSDPIGNKIYYEKKWGGRQKDAELGYGEIIDNININMNYPTDKTGVFFNVEESGFFKW